VRRRALTLSAASRRSTLQRFSPRTFAASPSGGCISRMSRGPSVVAMVVSDSTPKARDMRRSVPTGDQSGWMLCAFGFSQEARPGRRPARAVGRSRSLELRVFVDLRADANERAFAFEARDPVTQGRGGGQARV